MPTYAETEIYRALVGHLVALTFTPVPRALLLLPSAAAAVHATTPSGRCCSVKDSHARASLE